MSALKTFNKIKYSSVITQDDVNLGTLILSEVSIDAVTLDEFYEGMYEDDIIILHLEFNDGSLLDADQRNLFIKCNERLYAELVDEHVAHAEMYYRSDEDFI